jgi:hypothetical protein
MVRRARAGDIVLVKSRKMTGTVGPKHCRGGWEKKGKRRQKTKYNAPCPLLFQDQLKNLVLDRHSIINGDKFFCSTRYYYMCWTNCALSLSLFLSVCLYLMHLVYDEVGDLQVPVNHRVHLKVVVVFTKRIDQRLGYLITNVKGS